MPIPALALALGASALTGVLNSFLSKDSADKNTSAQLAANRENVQYQKDANQQARDWALEDWHRMNQYNHPTQQMQRFREAGLNPNLIYGSGAQSTSAMIARSDPKAPQVDAPHNVPFQVPDLGGSMAQYLNMTQAQTEIDKNRAQLQLIAEQREKIEADTAGRLITNARDSFKFGLDRELRDVTKETAINKNKQILAATEGTVANMQKTMEETKYIPLKYTLQKQQLELSKAKTSAEIANVHAETAKKVFELSNISPLQKKKLETEIINMKRTGELREWELNMRKAGLNPNDPAWMKILVNFIYNFAESQGIDLGVDVPFGAMDAIKAGGEIKNGGRNNFPSGGWKGSDLLRK